MVCCRPSCRCLTLHSQERLGNLQAVARLDSARCCLHAAALAGGLLQAHWAQSLGNAANFVVGVHCQLLLCLEQEGRAAAAALGVLMPLLRRWQEDPPCCWYRKLLAGHQHEMPSLDTHTVAAVQFKDVVGAVVHACANQVTCGKLACPATIHATPPPLQHYSKQPRMAATLPGFNHIRGMMTGG